MRELKIKGIYQHFKGDYYLVEDIGIHSESGEKCVIYRSLYGDMTIYIRPYDNFMEPVDKQKYPNAQQTYKFELKEIQSVRK